jgi:hypothetical protein
VDPNLRDDPVLGVPLQDRWKIRKVDEKFSNQVCRKLVARAQAGSTVPATIVEDEGWRIAWKYMQPEVELISRRTLSDDIGKVYSEKKTDVQRMISDHQTQGCKFSLTTDGWSSNRRTPFIGVTIHYIDRQSWSLVSTLLAFRHMPGHHDAESLSAMLVGVKL